MKCLTSLFLAGFFTLALANCSVNKSLEATQSVPEKIDRTTDEVKKTNSNMNTMVDQVQKTNTGMDTMVHEVQKTNDGIAKTTDEVKKSNDQIGTMIDQVKKTNDGIEKTNAAVHNQTLAVSLSEMLKEENTRYLFPPTGMIPAGQVFAQEASADEIIKLVFTFMTEIETSFPDPSEQMPGGGWTAETIKRVDHDKKVKFTAASVIAGLAPQGTVEQIIRLQIDNGGRFEQTAYQFLMFRYMFISDLLLKNQVLATPLANPGLLEEAIDLTEIVSMIATLPYNDRIQVTTTGMLAAEDNYSFKIDPRQVVALWKRLNRAFEQELDPKYKALGSPVSQKLEILKSRVKTHLPAAQAEILE
jgi:hypothetical protein